jgi:hypothetical protein
MSCVQIKYHFLRLGEGKILLVGYNVCLGMKVFLLEWAAPV